VPEYLVHFSVLERIAKEYDLELVMREEFPNFYARHESEYRDLLHKMRVDALNSDEWEAASLYVVFCFRKKGEYRAPRIEAGKELSFDLEYGSIVLLK
jgi:hypothetical protein